MRRLILAVLSLMVATSAFALQESSRMKTTASRSEMTTTVDCSTIADSTISSNVKASLAKAPSLKDSTIDVTTSAGVVTLKGMVKKAGLKGVATRMAKRVDCVKKVDNQLTAAQDSSGSSKRKSN